ncbi:NnrS protein involved in response to NO [hydrothermal vent metagenome]|uniref:NnrS protein involved in response to NO n=1 Tax=hydrothermal vent metagenome TaxID=652676 RepID=A0A3B0QYN6_9ZZZZ
MTTTAQKMRAYQGPKVLSRGFRPFFLSAGLFAAIAMPLWVAMQAFGVEPASSLSARGWHLHEMLFGYLGAVIAGFLLTAIPNWTGRLPVVGKSLALLWGLWLAGRLAMAFLVAAPIAAAVIDSAFLVVFAALLWREILAGKNIKNIPICLIITGLALANITFHILWLTENPTAPAERLALGMIAILISLIGGRIVPSFTRNWMVNQNLSPLPVSFDNIDKIGLALGIAATLLWVVFPDIPLTGMLFAAAAIVFFYRISRWRGLACGSEWLVVILHIGYLWLPVWFALMATSIFFPENLSQAAALHALSAGAIGTMTIAVVTRATLGHSGQPLTANFWTKVIYILVVTGAVLRVLADWLPLDFSLTVVLAGSLWTIAFALFVIIYGPMLVGRK